MLVLASASVRSALFTAGRRRRRASGKGATAGDLRDRPEEGGRTLCSPPSSYANKKRGCLFVLLQEGKRSARRTNRRRKLAVGRILFLLREIEGGRSLFPLHRRREEVDGHQFRYLVSFFFFFAEGNGTLSSLRSAFFLHCENRGGRRRGKGLRFLLQRSD